MEDKKRFLLNSALLYQKIIEQTDNNCLRKFLAFKIIINAMSFEDVVDDRKFTAIREVRDIFLAHKQNNQFSKAFNSSELVKSKNIDQLIAFMTGHLADQTNIKYFEELTDAEKLLKIENLAKQTLKLFEAKFYNGFRVSNNFLCTGENQIKEASSNNLSGCFYRYNSSKELSILANFFINNLSIDLNYPNALRNFKIDYIFHAVNMKDCIFKDIYNRYSIDGLYEVIDELGIGNITVLQELLTNPIFQSKYIEMRHIRNQIAGHMNRMEPLNDLFKLVDDFDIGTAYDFVSKLDKAVYDTAYTHFAIRPHYDSFSMKIENTDIIAISGLKNSDY
ncbi:hypothetical protein [Arcicella lustrica]|uniref:Uncharacterized protein n=1 Tax=Arcicella lustrica TaxID=2984196 RepID=A0ABU5SMN6_9BACT|nr:hypothetical protein [Arcicella sp. DC25W]MEA5428530.1 hypothetical protein [Arcicella sp. DC25W]